MLRIIQYQMRRLDKILGITIPIFSKQNTNIKKTIFKTQNIKTGLPSYYKPISYNFSSQKPEKDSHEPSTSNPQADPQAQPQPQSTQKQITAEQAFNLSVGLPLKHSFKNELIVSQNRYKKQLKELREAILFEDLLKKQLDILVYDTNGKPYLQHLFKMFLMLVSAFGTLILFQQGLNNDKKLRVYIEKTTQGKAFKNIVKFLSFLLILSTLKKHIKFTRRYVQSITYHTEDETFTFVRRKIYGAKYKQKLSRFKILYTENPALLRRGTNYLNIENQNQYSIGYVFAWKKEDLFSHLISQRIKV